MQSFINQPKSLMHRGLRALGRGLLRTLVLCGLLLSLSQGVQGLRSAARQTQGVLKLLVTGRDLCNYPTQLARLRASLVPVGQLRRLVCATVPPHLTS